jgi:ABC-type bacteriocin/lantibiotic exporter with double-glycine peptidase domain
VPTFIFAFYKITPSIQIIFVQYLITKSNTQSVQNLSSFLKFYKHESNNQISKINNKSQLENVKKIEYKNFSFSYNKANKIINNLNLTLTFPGLIGIVGESGSGKTTVLSLILGLLKPKSGKFFLNNKYIPSSRIMNTLSGTVAYVPQKTIFFEDTIKNNILLNKKFDKKKFNKIINTVDLVKLLNNLPKREETIIHLSNNNLSGGQLQRISLARSLYQDPKLLIIDEGFNQLDSETELKVIENLRKLNLLLIMVYHKLNKRIKLDKVYKIYSGKFENIK